MLLLLMLLLLLLLRSVQVRQRRLRPTVGFENYGRSCLGATRRDVQLHPRTVRGGSQAIDGALGPGRSQVSARALDGTASGCIDQTSTPAHAYARTDGTMSVAHPQIGLITSSQEAQSALNVRMLLLLHVPTQRVPDGSSHKHQLCWGDDDRAASARAAPPARACCW